MLMNTTTTNHDDVLAAIEAKLASTRTAMAPGEQAPAGTEPIAAMQNSSSPEEAGAVEAVPKKVVPPSRGVIPSTPMAVATEPVPVAPQVALPEIPTPTIADILTVAPTKEQTAATTVAQDRPAVIASARPSPLAQNPTPGLEEVGVSAQSTAMPGSRYPVFGRVPVGDGGPQTITDSIPTKKVAREESGVSTSKPEASSAYRELPYEEDRLAIAEVTLALEEEQRRLTSDREDLVATNAPHREMSLINARLGEIEAEKESLANRMQLIVETQAFLLLWHDANTTGSESALKGASASKILDIQLGLSALESKIGEHVEAIANLPKLKLPHAIN
ncbi:MAG: hypothetical protein COV10_03795 [Candidatus Vogelbacteria bacterium CG10_big_fil_rev_8_21_14_0_10_51_16]|uniref:Uncharacterized protein n=1 Tax=Candidatus Vogelbacteria bacterium CG10_big_fil_rev_8_21_14_0_10_51_16 TaxID=1975045 RepID=A0A2H0RDI6_9BACT|nr:MAG: hypothetical protein COV10_03795 [Candidatus Vogelbacteria bacterium CG10_big_fil_rev_8_21_14_0_10_51_16]